MKRAQRPAAAYNQPTPAVPKMAYRVEEAGEALGIGRDLVFRLIKSGKLRSVMVVGRRLIPITAIQEFLSSG